MKDLLELRKKLKDKKPDFLRQDGHKLNRLKKKWRRPKGRHSKMRLKFRGYRKSPGVGYSSPKEVRGLNKDGLKEVVVSNLKELENVEDKCIAVIGRGVGLKKKIVLLKKIKELKIKCTIKDIDGFIKKVDEEIEERKKLSKKKIESKEKSKAEALKKKEKKERESKEEKEKKEKEEKRSVLEKKRTGREGEIA